MPSSVTDIYDILILAVKQVESGKQKKMAALSEFAGSMKDTWKDVDALEYLQRLREERTIG